MMMKDKIKLLINSKSKQIILTVLMAKRLKQCTQRDETI